jgi:hypothetical protein
MKNEITMKLKNHLAENSYQALFEKACLNWEVLKLEKVFAAKCPGTSSEIFQYVCTPAKSFGPF